MTVWRMILHSTESLHYKVDVASLFSYKNHSLFRSQIHHNIKQIAAGSFFFSQSMILNYIENICQSEIVITLCVIYGRTNEITPKETCWNVIISISNTEMWVTCLNAQTPCRYIVYSETLNLIDDDGDCDSFTYIFNNYIHWTTLIKMISAIINK